MYVGSDLRRALWHSSCLWRLPQNIHLKKFYLLLLAKKREITTSSPRCKTNLLLGIPPNPQAWFIPSSCVPATSIQNQAILPPRRQHFFAHYLSLIGSNFLHDNAHIKNILGWHLRSAHSLLAKKFLACFPRETTSRQFRVPLDYNPTCNLISRFLSWLHYLRTETGRQVWLSVHGIMLVLLYQKYLAENWRDDQRNFLFSAQHNVWQFYLFQIFDHVSRNRGFRWATMQKWLPDSHALWNAPLSML